MDTDAQIERAFELHHLEHFDEAGCLCRQVLAHEPDEFDALHLLGLIEMQRGHAAAAVELIGRAVAIDPDVAFAQASLGMALHRLNRSAEALERFDRALALEPDLVEVLVDRGNVLRILKRPEEALASYDRALALVPGLAEASVNRGNALQDLERRAEALAAYEHALAIAPNHPVAHCNAAGVLMALNRPLEALQSAERALALKADYPEAFCTSGLAHHMLGQWEQALACHNRALTLSPDLPQAWMNRGNALKELKRFDEALASYDRAIAFKPDYAEAYNNRGTVLQEVGRFDEALASYEKAFALKPDYADACNNHGAVLGDLGRYQEALATLAKALALEPDHAEALVNRGNALKVLGRSNEALASFDRAIGIKPGLAEAYFSKSLTLLLNGDYGNGWALHEWRWKSGRGKMSLRQFPQPLWLGVEPLAGRTILLHSEQGFGDTIQFCRYARQVKDLGARVIMQVPPALVSLLTALEGVDELIATDGPLPDFDCHCPLLSLPLAFKTTVQTVPALVPYLSADAGKTAFWHRLLGEKAKPRVGLCWSGGFRAHQPELWSTNERRNIPLSVISRLNSPAIDFYSLQKGEPAESEVVSRQHELWPGGNFHNYSSLLKDFSDTAALVANLDLIITVDTATAHLAAAMGKPTWILNRFDTCWRWLLDRDDSPWYPTVKLYRQGDKQDWDEVLDRVASDLQRAFSSRLPGRNSAVATNRNDEQSASGLQGSHAHIPSSPPSPGPDEQRLGLLLKQAVRLQREGRLDEALASYDKAIDISPDHAGAHNNRGVTLQELGRFEEALASYDEALALAPELAEALMNRGNVLQKLGRLHEALACHDKAIALKREYADAHYNRGNTLKALLRFEDALASYDTAIALRPDHAGAYHNRAVALAACLRLGEALAACDKAIALEPGCAEFHNNRGVVLQKLGRLDDALSCYDKALVLEPEYAEAYNNRGAVLSERNRFHDALAWYDKAIALKPDYAEAWTNRGAALGELGRFDEALACHDKAVAFKPDYAEAWTNRGAALAVLARFAEALACYDKALELAPDLPEALMNRGIALKDLGRSDEGLASLDKAIGIMPDFARAYYTKAFVLLLNGDYRNGWDLHEWRWKTSLKQDVRDFQRPLWLGAEPLEGKTILLHSEQGLGDTIQFCRYAPLVRKLAARVILQVPSVLVRLMASLDGVDQVVSRDEALPDFDFHCPLMSLPLAFKTTLENIPATTPYLSADPEKTADWARRLGAPARPRVGLVWSGGFRLDQPKLWSVWGRRNIPLSTIARLDSTGIDFYSLQKGEPAESEVMSRQQELWPGGNFHNYASLLKDFSDTAALVANLDLIVSVDTSTAHLAAAMGRPTWILNRFDTCWRWLLDRDDSPWYPTVKLYRQEAGQQWGEVLDRVAADLLVRDSGIPLSRPASRNDHG